MPVNLLTAEDSEFEGGTVGSWVNNNIITIANSTTFANTGTHSLRLTSTAAGGPMICNTGFYDGISAGQVITVSASFRAAPGVTGVACQMYIDWYTAAHAFLPPSTFDGGTVDSNTGWTAATPFDMTAPATAGSFILNCQVFNTTSGEVHYLDSVAAMVPTPIVPNYPDLNRRYI